MCVNVVGVFSIPPRPCYSGWINKRQMVAVLTMPSNKTRMWSSFWHVHKFRVKNQILLFQISFTCITNWVSFCFWIKKTFVVLFLLIRKNASFLSTLCGSHTCTTGWCVTITLTASIPTSTEKPFCGFSEAQDCSLMMVPAWTETYRSKCYNFQIVVTFLWFYNSVHQLE